MSNVINRITGKLLLSVNTPDYPETEWLINPDLSAIVTVPNKYWKVDGDTVREATTAEKAIIDALEPIPKPDPLIKVNEEIENIKKRLDTLEKP